MADRPCEYVYPETTITRTVYEKVQREQVIPQKVEAGVGGDRHVEIQDVVTMIEVDEPRIVEDVAPAHPCEQPATVLSRSMMEVTCSEGATHWRRTEDHLWCADHIVPGTMTHLDGTISQHPHMSAQED